MALSSGISRGFRAKDGTFESDPDGPTWLAFDQFTFYDDYIDTVYWCPTTGELATLHRRAFALNESLIDNPATYALGGRLDIYASAGRWLTAERRGIVVLDWRHAYERLKGVPRIRIDEAITREYRRQMVPPPLPNVVVRLDKARGG